MGDLEVKTLPACDISTALAQAKVYRRFLQLIDEALAARPTDPVLGLSALHTVRIQRLAEGIAAFSTACLADELLWMARPVLELFASQCVLLFVPLKHAQTAPERAALYHGHARFSRQRFANKHAKFGSNLPDDRGTDDPNIAEPQNQAHHWKPNESWHKLELTSSLIKGLDARCSAMKSTPIAGLAENVPAMIDLCNSGVHGSPFAGHQLVSHERRIVDNRTHMSMWADFPSFLANASLEMTAFLFGKHPLVQPMFESALGDATQTRTLPPFPTVLLSLNS